MSLADVARHSWQAGFQKARLPYHIIYLLLEKLSVAGLAFQHTMDHITIHPASMKMPRLEGKVPKFLGTAEPQKQHAMSRQPDITQSLFAPCTDPGGLESDSMDALMWPWTAFLTLCRQTSGCTESQGCLQHSWEK